MTACFKLTDQSLEELRKRNIPENIINLLNKLNNQEYKGDEQFIKVLKNTIGEENTKTYKELILEHAKTLELVAIHRSGDAYIKENGLYFLICPPLFKHKHQVEEADFSLAITKAIKVKEKFDTPKDNERYYHDISSLVKYLSGYLKLPKATTETINMSMEILSKCISKPLWREHFFSRLDHSRNDLGRPELAKTLMVGIKRLEALKTLPESVKTELADRRKKLEEMRKGSDQYADVFSSKDSVPSEEKTEAVANVYEGSSDIYDI